MITPRELKLMFKRGENISAVLRQQLGSSINTEDIIEWSYDIQAGSYIRALADPEMAEHKRHYSGEIARILTSLGPIESILEPGVGDGTMLGQVLQQLPRNGLAAYGFDLSWSRTAFARRWLQDKQIAVRLCTGSLLNIPFATESIDIVYTSHAIESNHGKEEVILRELYRVARKYLVLLEPAYELADREARQRMEEHGYCRGLKEICQRLGYRILDHRLFPYSGNPLNPTGLLLVEKSADSAPSLNDVFACPRFKTPLQHVGGMLFSAEALAVYPVVGNIACLRVENGIAASSFMEFCGDGISP